MNPERPHLLGCIIFLCFIITAPVRAEHPDDGMAEEILLVLEVEQSMNFDISGYLLQEKLYLSATALFSILNIKTEQEAGGAALRVFFPDPNRPFRFDFRAGTVKGPGPSIRLSDEEVIRAGGDVYILKDLLEQLFGFEMVFDFRELKVKLSSEHSLPVIRYRRRKHRYERFEPLPPAPVPEVGIPGKHYLLKGLVADWSFNTTHTLNSHNYAYDLGVGGHLLGGDLALYGSGSKQYGIHWDRARGRWRYPIYSPPAVKQILLGDYNHKDMLGGGHLPFRGVTITNRPKAPRHTFGAFTLADGLREGWDTELYVNRRLTDYAIGSLTDRYHFTAPLRYGSNFIQLKQYNPEGLSSLKQYLIYIPQDFLPPGTFEYALTAGRYSNYIDRDFARMNVKLGVFPFLTVGGGTHYAPDHALGRAGGEAIPFVQSWLRLGSGITATGSHTFNYLTTGSLRMISPHSRSLYFDIKKYHQASVFNRTQKSLETSLSASFPVRIPFADLSAFFSTRYTRNQSSSQNLNFYGGITSRLPFGIGLRLNTRLSLRDNSLQKLHLTQHSTQISLYKRIFRRLLLRPSIEYNHTLDKIINSQLEMSLRVFRNGYMHVSYGRNHLLDQNRFLLSFRLNLPFARHSSFVRSNRNNYTYNQSTSGTLAFDGRQKVFYTDNRSWIGRAALTLDPFLDLNNNSRQDTGEPSVDGMSATIYKQGDRLPSYRDMQLVTDLVPYDRYLVQVHEAGLPNPLWVPEHKTYQLQVMPHTLNTLPVPITVAGEVSGSVLAATENEIPPLYDLDIHISSTEGGFEKVIKTYSGGFFYYVGLKPGTYMASLDRGQLSRLSLEAVKSSVQFVIEPTEQGDIVDGLTLKVRPKQEQHIKKTAEKVFALQVGAFLKKRNAVHLATFIEMITDYTPTIIYNKKEELYKCQLGLFNNREIVRIIIRELQQRKTDLFWDAFVIELPTEP